MFTGIILWKRTYKDIHRYGVQFALDDEELKKYLQIFNRFATLQKKSKEPLKSCSYCTFAEFPCS
ncbi:MAG TPA: hypothetical protein DCP90_00450 [Clostridiales bacterium]|nr:MAG: hypothetical protein A2Y22_08165 [Clostridiales bacterium GWD2_32_59]HAN09066.1 hypothetical protein [Clostridiales bacterium]